MNRLLSLFAAALLLMPCAARKASAADIYAFGVGSCLTDSVVYFSAIQRLDGAQLEKKGFLKDRFGYTIQFEQYLQERFTGHQTCALFFSKNKKRLERTYTKLRRRQAKSHKNRIVSVAAGEFSFALPAEASTAETPNTSAQ